MSLNVVSMFKGQETMQKVKRILPEYQDLSKQSLFIACIMLIFRLVSWPCVHKNNCMHRGIFVLHCGIM